MVIVFLAWVGFWVYHSSVEPSVIARQQAARADQQREEAWIAANARADAARAILLRDACKSLNMALLSTPPEEVMDYDSGDDDAGKVTIDCGNRKTRIVERSIAVQVTEGDLDRWRS
jgi:hypothetical protein